MVFKQKILTYNSSKIFLPSFLNKIKKLFIGVVMRKFCFVFILVASLFTTNTAFAGNDKEGYVKPVSHKLDVKFKKKDGELIDSIITVKEIKGKIMWDDDIVLGDVDDFHNKKGKFKDPLILSLGGASTGGGQIGGFWPQSVVPYTLDWAFSTTHKNEIKAQLAYMESNFGVNFVERTNQANYIHFTYLPSSHFACGTSPLGMQGGKQEVRLNTDCVKQRTIVHETLHSLGYYHEHNRSDRDSYITVNWSNLNDCYDSFKISSDIETENPYDIKSIMHYGSMTSGNCVYDPSEPMFTTIFGDHVAPSLSLSALDKETLQSDYGYTAGTQINWNSHACYGEGSAQWGSIAGAAYYQVEVKGLSDSRWSTLITTTSTRANMVEVSRNSYVRVVGINAEGIRSAVSNQDYAKYFSACM